MDIIKAEVSEIIEGVRLEQLNTPVPPIILNPVAGTLQGVSAPTPPNQSTPPLVNNAESKAKPSRPPGRVSPMRATVEDCEDEDDNEPPREISPHATVLDCDEDGNNRSANIRRARIVRPMRATVEDCDDVGDINVREDVDNTNVRPIRELDTETPLSARQYANARRFESCKPQQKAGEADERPSSYLRGACPLCFGPNVRAQTPSGM